VTRLLFSRLASAPFASSSRTWAIQVFIF
jgi:hypothetical protein